MSREEKRTEATEAVVVVESGTNSASHLLDVGKVGPAENNETSKLKTAEQQKKKMPEPLVDQRVPQ